MKLSLDQKSFDRDGVGPDIIYRELANGIGQGCRQTPQQCDDLSRRSLRLVSELLTDHEPRVAAKCCLA